MFGKTFSRWNPSSIPNFSPLAPTAQMPIAAHMLTHYLELMRQKPTHLCLNRRVNVDLILELFQNVLSTNSFISRDTRLKFLRVAGSRFRKICRESLLKKGRGAAARQPSRQSVVQMSRVGATLLTWVQIPAATYKWQEKKSQLRHLTITLIYKYVNCECRKK